MTYPVQYHMGKRNEKDEDFTKNETQNQTGRYKYQDVWKDGRWKETMHEFLISALREGVSIQYTHRRQGNNGSRL